MKKIILLLSISIICSTISTHINAMGKNWLTIRQSINTRKMYGGRQGASVVLSENASWEEFHKAQRREISANLDGDHIVSSIKDAQNISNYHNNMLEIIRFLNKKN